MAGKVSVDVEKIKNCFKELSSEALELYLNAEVPETDSAPSPLTFLREWVLYNRPLVVRGGVCHWPACQKWSNSYLRERLGDAPVTITCTPNGLADAPQGDLFVMPEERSSTLGDFIDIIEDKRKQEGVFYIQKQNSNLTQEFPQLLQDIEEDIPWATEALGKRPDAVNFWMGDSGAVTSMHKDPYENIYCVVRGQKNIILHPPTDLPWVPYKKYKPAVYKYFEEFRKFEIVKCDDDSPEVPWVAVDPLNPDLETFPDYANATKIQVTLGAGDLLYLPSFWFHHLTQSDDVIAVNFWYDMEFDIKYNYYNLLSNMKQLCMK